MNKEIRILPVRLSRQRLAKAFVLLLNKKPPESGQPGASGNSKKRRDYE